MRPDSETGKLVPAVTGPELVELLAWPGGPELEVDDFVSAPSFDIHGDLVLALAKRVVEHARRPEIAGVVVTHGTDTMEETVYLVDRLLDSETPVVLTGAQRGADQPDADGPRNFRDAVRTAVSPETAGRGALVAFAAEVQPAREACKVHTSRPHGFASPGYGPVGHVDGERVVFQRRPDRRAPLPEPEGLAAVDLIRLYAGSDGRFIRASVASGASAIVLECTGRGNANDQVVPAVREAVEAGMPVAICSRCVERRVQAVYGRGGGRDLAAAGDLAGPKARVLLQLALGAGLDAAEALAGEAG